MSGNAPKPELFDDISFGGFDLVTANFKYSKDNTLQKVILSPFKLIPSANYASDVRLNFSQKDKISTFGVGFGFDNCNPFNKLSNRVDRKFKKMPQRPAQRNQNVNETNAQYKAYLDAFNQQANQDRVDYFKSLAENAFSFTVGYNISLFDIIGGDKVTDASGLVTNKYVTNAHSFSADLNYSVNEDLMFSVGAAYQRKRKSAAEDQKIVEYIGYNSSFSWRAFYLQNRANLLNNTEYVKNFFIPSILVGVSFESINANGDKLFYEDGYKYKNIWMPYLDFKITPTNQFRIGIPIQKYDTVNEHQTGLGPFLQYNLTLANKAG